MQNRRVLQCVSAPRQVPHVSLQADQKSKIFKIVEVYSVFPPSWLRKRPKMIQNGLNFNQESPSCRDGPRCSKRINFPENGLAAWKAPVTGGAALRGSGLGFVVSGLGFVVLGLGFAVWGLGFAKPWWPLQKNLKKTTRPESTNSLLRLY